MRVAVVVVMLIGVAGSGCRKPAAKAPAAEPVAPAAAEDTRPRLTIEVEPADAEILVDDVPVGSGDSVGSIPLDPGLHQIVVRKAGYDTYRAEVAIEAEDESLRVTLEPEG